jgi:hypothetical protein
MIYLFSKKLCGKCAYVKAAISKLGMIGKVQEYDIETIEGLGLAAWFELVGTAESSLPILLETNKHDVPTKVTIGAINIRKELEGRCKK